MANYRTITEVVENRSCLGCGACSYACPSNSIQLVNVISEGIRPYVTDTEACANCTDCLDVCPADGTDLTSEEKRPGIIKELYVPFGPVLEIWEGHACDEEIRFEGSSGGALTALSLFCIEKEDMAGVLHIGQSPTDPLSNSTYLSANRSELLSRTGSRYAPASACDRLDFVENATNPCVFIGQPSETAAYRKAQRLRPSLDKNTGLVLSFFCAGTPSSQGTLDLLKRFDVPAPSVEALRYRGKGWPGFFTTRQSEKPESSEHLTYRETWQFLRNYRPLSTFLFPDASGEDADISCGDPWYHDVKTSKSGSSLIVVRTERGREILAKAVAAGYLAVEKRKPHHLVQSQGSLAKKRGEAWGRILAYKLLLLKTPRYLGFSLFRNWLNLPAKARVRCILSALKRGWREKYFKKFRFDPKTGTQL